MELFETDKNLDNKEFLRHAGPFVITKKNIPIGTTLRLEIQKIAINHLGLKDIFQLRDRFEGQAYMDKLMLKVSSLAILEKDRGISLIDWATIKWDKKADYTLIKINSITYRVIPFFYGSLPIVNTTIKEPIIFCAIRADFQKGIICGVLSDFSFDDNLLFETRPSSAKAKSKRFIGFKFLKELAGN